MSRCRKSVNWMVAACILLLLPGICDAGNSLGRNHGETDTELSEFSMPHAEDDEEDDVKFRAISMTPLLPNQLETEIREVLQKAADLESDKNLWHGKSYVHTFRNTNYRMHVVIGRFCESEDTSPTQAHTKTSEFKSFLIGCTKKHVSDSTSAIVSARSSQLSLSSSSAHSPAAFILSTTSSKQIPPPASIHSTPSSEQIPRPDSMHTFTRIVNALHKLYPTREALLSKRSVFAWYDTVSVLFSISYIIDEPGHNRQWLEELLRPLLKDPEPIPI